MQVPIPSTQFLDTGVNLYEADVPTGNLYARHNGLRPGGQLSAEYDSDYYRDGFRSTSSHR